MTAPAGWYRQGEQARYWDGAAWTERFRPIPDAAPPTTLALPADDDRRRRAGPWLMFGGAAAVAVGCFLPWVKASAPLMGSITVSGVDNGGDGTIFLVLAAVLAAVVYRAQGAPSRAKQLAAAGLVGIIGAGLLFEANSVSDRLAAAAAASDLISTSYGSGLVLMGAGVIAAVVGWTQMNWSPTE